MKKTITLICVLLACMFSATAIDETSDLNGHWSEPYITYLYEKGVILPSGVNFKPDQKISRAELMRYLNRAFDFTENTPIYFDDMIDKQDAWYYKDVEIAVKHGYINGTGNNNMSPLQYLDREQAATIIGRLHKAQPELSTLSFADSDEISNWSAPYISMSEKNGYINGYTDNTFKPQNHVTRGEIARILYSFCGTIIDEPGVYTAEHMNLNTKNVTISTADVMLENTVIYGNLYITEGALSNNITLNNIEVKGDLIISGGTVYLSSVTADNIIVSSGTGRVLDVTFSNDCDIEHLNLVTDANVHTKDLSSSGLDTIFINEAINVDIDGLISKISIGADAEVELHDNAVLMEVYVHAAAKIHGTGSIQTLIINESGSEISCPVGAYDISDGFSAHINGQLVTSNDDVSISPVSIVFDKSEEAAQHKNVEFDLNSATSQLTDITYGEDERVRTRYYDVYSSKIELYKEAFLDLPIGEYEFSFNFDDGKSIIVDVTILDSTRSFVTPFSINYNMSEGKDLTVVLSRGKSTLLREIKYQETVLTENVDYTIEDDEIIISSEFLKTISDEEGYFYFIMTSGNTPSLEIFFYI